MELASAQQAQILNRLLELPGSLRRITTQYLDRMEKKDALQVDHDYLRAELYLAGLNSGAIAGKNAEARDAELLALLDRSTEYKELEEGLRAGKLAVTSSDLELKNIRLEADILIAAIRALTYTTAENELLHTSH